MGYLTESSQPLRKVDIVSILILQRRNLRVIKAKQFFLAEARIQTLAAWLQDPYASSVS